VLVRLGGDVRYCGRVITMGSVVYTAQSRVVVGMPTNRRTSIGVYRMATSAILRSVQCVE